MFEAIELNRTARVLALNALQFPIEVHVWEGGTLEIPRGGTCYGMVTRGSCCVRGGSESQFTMIGEGMYFCLPDGLELMGGLSSGLVIVAKDYRGYRQFGGPLEKRGRLKYIDGCSDTLLITAPVIGEPCLNHLHIPPGTNQTEHTHPSERIGVILRGSGYCLTPEGRYRLQEGMGWRIPPGQLHSFHTGEREFLDVIAWHPDSDFGPSHQDHPMVNLTLVGEVPASKIEAIQTKDITA
jgi:quercetin dioxygenase-like cupin family protein